MARVLNREFKRAQRYGTPLSVGFLDLDDFKSVNDHHGHDLGGLLEGQDMQTLQPVLVYT